MEVGGGKPGALTLPGAGEGEHGLGSTTSGSGMGGRKEKEQKAEDGRDNLPVQPRPPCLQTRELEAGVTRDGPARRSLGLQSLERRRGYS